MKKSLCMGVAFALIIAMLAGCRGGSNNGGGGGGDASEPAPAQTTQQEETQESAPATEATADEPSSSSPSSATSMSGAGALDFVSGEGLEWRQKTDPVSFTCFIDGTANDWVGWGNEPISVEITNLTGVTVDVKTAASTEHEELNAMMASGTLPDFIKCWEPNLRATLWKQGFLSPLNQLIDQYAPNTWNIVPTDMNKIYTEADGNWYFIAGYYCDVDRITDMPGVQATTSGTTMNIPAYDSLGRPPMGTLEEYKSLLLRVKEELGDEFPYIIFDQQHGSPQDGNRSMAHLISRIMGGDAVKAIGSDGKVHLNFRDETYKQAILYINDLYRSGLINKEMFTLTTSEQNDPLMKNQEVFAFWGQPWWSYQFDPTDDGPYQVVEPPKVPGITPQWESAVSGVGGPEAAITTNCKDPERAILYYQFLLSDEGQVLTYHGREGIDFTWEDGMPKNTEAKSAMWAEDFGKMQSEMGILNYNVTWFATMWADQLYYYWLNKELGAYLTDTLVNNQYARNERNNQLLIVETDSEAAVIQAQVFDLWKAQLPKMYLAETEADCLAALDELISKAENLGLKDLEDEYTAIHARWQALLN